MRSCILCIHCLKREDQHGTMTLCPDDSGKRFTGNAGYDFDTPEQSRARRMETARLLAHAPYLPAWERGYWAGVLNGTFL